VLDDRGGVLHRFENFLRAVNHAESSLPPIILKNGITRYNLRYTPGRCMCGELHLPQAMHRGDVPLREVEVVVVARKNVRDQEAIVNYGDGSLQSGNGKLFLALIAIGFDVLPETMKRIEEAPER